MTVGLRSSKRSQRPDAAQDCLEWIIINGLLLLGSQLVSSSWGPKIYMFKEIMMNHRSCVFSIFFPIFFGHTQRLIVILMFWQLLVVWDAATGVGLTVPTQFEIVFFKVLIGSWMDPPRFGPFIFVDESADSSCTSWAVGLFTNHEWITKHCGLGMLTMLAAFRPISDWPQIESGINMINQVESR